ncbi:uncharacterized protein PGTG_14531 [Puccinia graminis f. sp. tritici CRL 75-36-700-3]|uniref:Uncharacterized protein n=1 Tax=Puccinia graminis f. sp. tritici (strain CRL 75-36-700-3 / race SCCL) TaxID=418459 RepID=E3KU41_PUCGT|nr:uncharacterized protein PGTG_14531 [Puccinia graminis f. sp. tritici CRL 75-36-700-3]EFP87816.1 hypothetical protein PGTG_14531 [Puccinia graminis f. sp. tritici CRL 75-36-700-3]
MPGSDHRESYRVARCPVPTTGKATAFLHDRSWLLKVAPVRSRPPGKLPLFSMAGPGREESYCRCPGPAKENSSRPVPVIRRGADLVDGRSRPSIVAAGREESYCRCPGPAKENSSRPVPVIRRGADLVDGRSRPSIVAALMNGPSD